MNFLFCKDFCLSIRCPTVTLVDRQDSGLLLESMFLMMVFYGEPEPQAHWNHSIGPTCPGQLPKSMLLV